MMGEEIYYRVSEVVKILGYKSNSNVLHHVYKGNIFAERVGRIWFIPKSEVLKFSLENHQRAKSKSFLSRLKVWKWIKKKHMYIKCACI